jgi:hypothetical protein
MIEGLGSLKTTRAEDIAPAMAPQMEPVG